MPGQLLSQNIQSPSFTLSLGSFVTRWCVPQSYLTPRPSRLILLPVSSLVYNKQPLSPRTLKPRTSQTTGFPALLSYLHRPADTCLPYPDFALCKPLSDSVRSRFALWPETCDCWPDTGWSHSFLHRGGESIRAFPQLVSLSLSRSLLLPPHLRSHRLGVCPGRISQRNLVVATAPQIGASFQAATRANNLRFTRVLSLSCDSASHPSPLPTAHTILKKRDHVVENPLNPHRTPTPTAARTDLGLQIILRGKKVAGPTATTHHSSPPP